MFALQSAPAGTKSECYSELLEQARALLAGERDRTANAANLASLIFHSLPELNWAGFYFMKAGELVLGPFQGKPACVRIAVGRGVCGTAARERKTIVVPDVQAFPGHIACDSASNSEIVVPILDSRLRGNDNLRRDDTLIGVLDLDSPLKNRFDADDARGLEALVALFIESTDLGA
ncbi:MAG: GAF domain-containing protein [Pseudomonadota bacterium]|nr:GAF domain-containing protein [Pseudomonadota bacterium]